jgi:hypothetical protein
MPSSGMWRRVDLVLPNVGRWLQPAATCSRWFFARRFFYSEDGDDTFLRNVGSHKIYTAPHPRRRHFHGHRCENLSFYNISTLWSCEGPYLIHLNTRRGYSTSANVCDHHHWQNGSFSATAFLRRSCQVCLKLDHPVLTR